MQMDQQEYGQRLFLLKQTIVTALRGFAVWDALLSGSDDSTPKHEDLRLALFEYPGFFESVLDVCFDNVVISMGKAFETGEDAVGLNTILKAAQDNQNNFGVSLTIDEMRDLRKRINSSKKLYETNIKLVRDKMIAHMDTGWIVDKNANGKKEIMNGHDFILAMKKILADMKEAYNQLVDSFSGANLIEDNSVIASKNDTKLVLELIMDKMHRQRTNQDLAQHL